MRQLRTLAMAAAISVYALGQNVQFKGDALGMSLDEFRDKYHHAYIGPKKSGGYIAKVQDPGQIQDPDTPQPTAAGKNVDPFYFFTSEPSKLYSIMFDIESRDFSYFVNAYSEKFGKPTKTENEVLQNQMGATTNSTVCTWNIGNCTIAIHEIYKVKAKGLISYTDNKLTKEEQDKLKKSAKDSASDL